MDKDIEKIGIIGEEIVNRFQLLISPDTPIYIGLSNRIHMENKHRETYLMYGDCLSEIISSPDHLGRNPHDDSLEYYKKYGNVTVNIKLAVRPSGKGVYFAKTLYEVNNHSINSFLKKGRIQKIG